MNKCAHTNCKTKFSVTNHKYKCAICENNFCDEHSCHSSYIKHFKGLEYFDLDNVIRDEGYVCQNCFQLCGPAVERITENLFKRNCHIDGCDHKLNSFTTIKRACISCGMIACDTHSIPKSKISDEWLRCHTNFPLGEMICINCSSNKSAESCEYKRHPKALNLQLAAGSPEGKNKAVIVHGILSDPSALSWFAKNLVNTESFDSVWLYDDLSYKGRVNEATRFALGDVPLGVDVKVILKAGIKILGRKAYQVIDLPSYIVEGAARKLASDIKLLNWEKVCLIGHSLGGLVVRCAAEAYDRGEQVNNVISLGSPFQAWSKIHSPREWEMTPIDNIKYLVLLGKDDWVTTHRSLGNLTKQDDDLKNTLKAIFPGLDHTNIHKNATKSYIFKFLKDFLSNDLFESTENFFVRDVKNNKKGFITSLHGKLQEDDSSFTFSGDWIEFEKI